MQSLPAGAVIHDPKRGSMANISHPAYAMAAFVVLTFFPYLLPLEYMQIIKLATPGQHAMVCALIAGVVFGLWVLYDMLAQPRFLPDARPQSDEFIRAMYQGARALIIVSIAANAIVFGYAAPRLAESVFAAKGALEDFAGVNILTQSFLYAIGPYIFLSEILKKPYWRLLLVLSALLALRAFLMAERLALMEIMVPALVVLSLRRHIAIKVGRLLALMAAVPVVFVTAELFRSFWSKFVEEGGWAYLDFSFILQWNLERMALYYTDAINKFYLILQTEFFYTTAFYEEGIQRILARLGFEPEGNSALSQWVELFGTGNPEMTNPGGLAQMFTDLGWWGVPALLVLALALLLFHWRASRGSIFALAVYPVLYLTIVELPRFVYIYQSRSLFPLIFFVMVWVACLLLSSRVRTPMLADSEPDGLRPLS
jgi:oligosaccharide repeat unit polymerase